MELTVTKELRQALQTAGSNARLSQATRDLASQAAAHDSVAWSTLKTVAADFNASRSQEDAPWLLHRLCAGCTVVLPSAPPKPPNPQLAARRAALQAELENRQYAAMVADVTKGEREAEEARRGLHTSHAQLAFGGHVLATMFTFFALCYWGTKHWLGWDDTWAGLASAVGLTAGLLLEAWLLIIRSNMPAPLEQQYPHLFDPKVWNKAKNSSRAPSASSATAMPTTDGTTNATFAAAGSGLARAGVDSLTQRRGQDASSSGDNGLGHSADGAAEPKKNV